MSTDLIERFKFPFDVVVTVWSFPQLFLLECKKCFESVLSAGDTFNLNTFFEQMFATTEERMCVNLIRLVWELCVFIISFVFISMSIYVYFIII